MARSVVGRRLANRHGASLVDLDERIEAAAGRTISAVFAEDGEAGFRALERAAIVDLGPADPEPDVRRVISTGGGAVVDPRNRWALYRGRTSVWLDGRPEVLAQRLRRSPNVRPLVTGRDPIGTLRDLAAKRERFYGASDIHQSGVAEVHGVVDAVEARLGRADRAAGTTLLRTSTPIGRFVLGDGIAADALAAELDAMRAPRAILVSEPGAWAAVGERLATGLRERGREVVHVLLPEGEAAKRLEIVETAARELAGLRVERSEPLVAVGGGALGDTAGFLAAVYLRGVRIIQVPTTLVAQIDSAIGGKTGVDLPEGKNLVGAFHQPSAIIIDIAMLRTLPERQMRAALGEAVKMAALGDERLFELLEADGPAIARGDEAVFASGVLAELVERAGWAKVEVVLADERERGASIRPDHPQPRALPRARIRGGRWLRRAAPRRGRRLWAAGGVPDRGRGGCDTAGAGGADRRVCSMRSDWRPSRSPTRSPRSWITSRPTRSMPRAASAGCCRPPTGS